MRACQYKTVTTCQCVFLGRSTTCSPLLSSGAGVGHSLVPVTEDKLYQRQLKTMWIPRIPLFVFFCPLPCSMVELYFTVFPFRRNGEMHFKRLLNASSVTIDTLVHGLGVGMCGSVAEGECQVGWLRVPDT